MSQEPQQPLSDENLAALYREASLEQPSPRHDDKVLAAARAELVAAKAKARRARAWRVPFALAATLVLTVALSLSLERERLRDEAGMVAVPPPDNAPVSPDLAVPAGSAAPAPANSAPGPDKAPAAPPGNKAPGAATPETPEPFKSGAAKARVAPLVAPPEPAPVPAAPRPPAASESTLAPTGSPAYVPAPALAPAPAPAAKPAAASDARNAGAESTAAPASAAPNLSRGMLKERSNDTATRREAATVAQPTRSPEDWVAEIRALRQAGRESEAQAALARLRQAYPDFAIPQDLILGH